MVKAIVGANWGDEGKGKITDMFADASDVVIRFQGGANAGHTIINPYGKFALHQLPSGVFHQRVTNIIGNGVAVNIPKLKEELDSVIKGGVPRPRLLVSDRAQMVMPYHVLFDQLEEERLGGKAFGSTKSGIAPFYSDKYAKIGFQICELFDEDALMEKIRNVLEMKNIIMKHLYGQVPMQPGDLFEILRSYRQMIEPFVADTTAYIGEAIARKSRILLEGQLGSMKDPDHGIYPMVTSSSTLAGFGTVGAGIPPYEINEIVAVTKAYSSAVGAGEFVSEIHGEDADELRMLGGDAGEFGATTGRPRRMGWFDCVATHYGCRVQGATEVALTAIDCLSHLDEIPICVTYKIDGKETKDFPNQVKLKRAQPVWTKLKGWKTDIRGVTSFEDLPKEAQEYVFFIEKALETPINIVSTGPKREEIIIRS